MTDSLILKYLRGEASAEEKAEILTWLEDSEDNRKHFSSMAIVYSSVSTSDVGVTDRILARLNARIEADNYRHHRSWRRWIPVFVAAASIAAILYTGNALRKGMQDVIPEREYITYLNTSKDISAIMLEDSSRVWLGKNSSVSCDVDGEEGDRVVKLVGNAYFDVHKDSLHPFIVQTGVVSVRVLGTAFCVKSDEEAGKVSVVLERGSVRLQTPDGINLVRLTPDQKAEFNASTGDIAVEMVNATPYIVQNYNKITLQNVSIMGIVSHINEMYGVKVNVLSPVDTTVKYNLNYKRTDTIDQLLDIVGTLTGVELEINKL